MSAKGGLTDITIVPIVPDGAPGVTAGASPPPRFDTVMTTVYLWFSFIILGFTVIQLTSVAEKTGKDMRINKRKTIDLIPSLFTRIITPESPVIYNYSTDYQENNVGNREMAGVRDLQFNYMPPLSYLSPLRGERVKKIHFKQYLYLHGRL